MNNHNNNHDFGEHKLLRGQGALLEWCKQKTGGYKNVNITNMTDSWQDGLALCALIHKFRPELINFGDLSKDERNKNVGLAFSVAEDLGIPTLLDVSDLTDKAPDERAIVTYVSQYYHKFKDEVTDDHHPETKKKRRYMIDILCDEESRQKLSSKNQTFL